MLNRFIIIICLIVVHFCSFADGWESGSYVYASGEYGFMGDAGENPPIASNRTTGIGLGTGYFLNKYLAVDAGTNFIDHSSNNFLGNQISLKYLVPLGNVVSAYMSLGPGYLICSTCNSNDNSFGFFGNMGALFKINNNWGINVEDFGLLPLKNSSTNTINMLSMGLMHAF